jgi:hypothetical protein
MARKRKKLTPKLVLDAANRLNANEPYAKIARELGVSAATLGRLRGVLNGDINKGNANIAALLKTAKRINASGMATKPTATPVAEGPGKDTHHGLQDMLAQLESDLAKLKMKCQMIREML